MRVQKPQGNIERYTRRERFYARMVRFPRRQLVRLFGISDLRNSIHVNSLSIQEQL